MKVAIVAPLVTAIVEPQLGGSQALLADVAQGLAARGHDVTVFAASGSRIDGITVVDTGVDPASLAATLFRADAAADASPATVDAFARTYALVARDRWDVVHNHAFDAPAIALAPTGVPVVHTLHLPPDPSVGAAVARSQATIACVSESQAAQWRSLARVDVVLPNGVPVERIGFDSRGGPGLLFAGRLSPEKGAAEAIEIARRARRPITLVGDPYDGAYTRSLDLGSEMVELRDAVPRSQLWEVMGRSSAVLCPVAWDEPFGLVAAEAMAAGTPVIAFARGALRDTVVDGVTGWLVEDVASAVAAAGRIAEIDREACRSHAERNLSLDRTLDAHEALYRELVRASTRTAS